MPPGVARALPLQLLGFWYTESYTGFYAVRLTNDAWPD
jgi:hypothetical protein